jgi:hypothetical protein
VGAAAADMDMVSGSPDAFLSFDIFFFLNKKRARKKRFVGDFTLIKQLLEYETRHLLY